jgi:hypothetical protein
MHEITDLIFPALQSDKTLNCPVCAFECVHLVSCVVEQNTQSVAIDCDEIYVSKIRPSGKRGSRIRIEAYCEEGHRFLLWLAFHKGSVYLHHERLEDCPGDADGGFEAPEELWRD